MNPRTRLNVVATCLVVALALNFGCSKPDDTSPKTSTAKLNKAGTDETKRAEESVQTTKPEEAKKPASAQQPELALDETKAVATAGKPEEAKTTQGAPSGVSPPSGNDAKTATSGATQELSADCAARLARIQAYDKSTPHEFYDLSRKPDEINRDIIKCIEECETFLKGCGTGATTCYVKSVLARMLMVRSDRFRDELRRQKVPAEEVKTKFRQYLARTSKFAMDVLACNLEDKRPRNEALHVLAGTAEKAGDFLGMRKYSQLILKEYPRDPRAGTLRFKVGRSFIWRGEYKEGAEYFHGVVDKNADDQEYVIYNIGLQEALQGSGDMKSMKQLMQTIKAEYPARIDKIKKKYIRAQAFQWMHIADFWIGYARLALGNANGAVEAFQSHISAVADLKAKSEANKEKLDPVIGIIENFRTRPMLTFVTDRYGKTPNIDLEEVKWVTPTKATLAEMRGNVVIAVFRRPKDPRSGGFFEFVDRLVKENQAKGLRAFSLGFVLGKEDPAADARRANDALEELQQRDINMPVGFDPDRKRQSIFRELGATVGTASCIVFNRRGEFAWTLADPKEIDRETLRMVVQRLLAE